MARLIEHPRESPVTCSPSPLPPVSPEPEVGKRNTHARMNLLERRPLLRPTSKAFPLASCKVGIPHSRADGPLEEPVAEPI